MIIPAGVNERECWNWQTGTFEVRVLRAYGFKSRLAHQIKTRKVVTLRVFCYIFEGNEYFSCALHLVPLFDRSLHSGREKVFCNCR